MTPTRDFSGLLTDSEGRLWDRAYAVRVRQYDRLVEELTDPESFGVDHSVNFTVGRSRSSLDSSSSPYSKYQSQLLPTFSQS